MVFLEIYYIKEALKVLFSVFLLWINEYNTYVRTAKMFHYILKGLICRVCMRALNEHRIRRLCVNVRVYCMSNNKNIQCVTYTILWVLIIQHWLWAIMILCEYLFAGKALLVALPCCTQKWISWLNINKS